MIVSKISAAVQNVFAALFFIVLFLGCIYNFVWLGVPQPLASAASAIIFAVTVYLFFLFGRFRRMLEQNQKYAVTVTRVTCAAVCALIILFAVFSDDTVIPTDLRIVDKAARILAEDFDPQKLNFDYTFAGLDEPQTWNIWIYFQNYPYNANLLLMITAFYKLHLSPVALNALSLCAAYLFTVMTAEKIYGNKTDAAITAVIAALFPVFYGYAAFYYTDTWSMTFVIISVYFAVTAFKSGKLFFFILSAVFAAFAYIIKNNALIIPIALIGYLICLVCREKRYKKTAVNAAVYLAVFAVISAGLQFITDSSGIYTKESRREYEFPKTHWIMMGVGGEGDYSQSDYLMTYNTSGYENKKEMNVSVIKERMSEYNPVSFIKLLFYYKAGRTWGGQVFLIPFYNPANMILNNPVFAVAATFAMYLTVLGVSASFRRGARDFTPLLFPRIILCGVFLLYLVWETRSRYLITFSPMFLLTFSNGLPLQKPKNGIAEK